MQDSRSDKSSVLGGSIDYGKSAYRCLVPVVMPPVHIQGLSGAGFSVAGLLPSAQVSSSAVVVDGLGWTRSEEGAAHVVVAPAQSRSSASSTVLSPDDGDDKTCSRGGNSSSNRSGSVLKEHDYIGLAEVSSSPGTMHASEIERGDGKARAPEVDLKLEETDLRLGLGPPDLSHSADAKSGAHAALLLASGFGRSPAAFSTSKQRSAEQKQSEGENGAYASYDHAPGKEGSTRLLGHDSAENADSSCAERSVSITEDASDKRPPILSDIPPSTLRQAQVLRNLEGIRVPTGLDFSTLPAPLSGQEFDVSRAAHFNGYATSRFALAAAKNGVKRAYDEAMIEKCFNHGEIRNSSPYEGVTHPTAAGGVQMLGGTAPPAGILTPEAELKRLSQQTKLPQSPFVYGWASVPPPALGTFGQFQSLQSKGIGGVASHSDSVADPPVSPWETRSKAPEALLPVERRPPTPMEKQQSPTPEVSPQKGQVVGWPPIRSFRKNTLAAPPKPVEDGEGSDETPDTGSGPATSPAVSLFVKVNMDGVPIGRKVDLNAYNGYEALIMALEEMFQRPHAGQGGAHIVSGNEKVPNELTRGRLINGSDFMLTYKDKEGDWMLVGDVPWGMFVNTVRRLWIMKASEATTGLVPRGSRNALSHGNTRSSTRT